MNRLGPVSGRAARALGMASLAALLLACPSRTEPSASAPPGGGDNTSHAVGPCNGRITVRLKGVDGGAFDAFAVDLGGVAVSVSGAALPFQPSAAGTVDLLVAGAWRLGDFAWPADGTPVDAVLTLTGGSAHLSGGATGGMIDACTAPLRFRIDPAQVDPTRCHAVVHLDLGASMAPFQGWHDLAFAPHFTIHY